MRQHLALLLLLCAAWRDAAAQLFRRPHDVVNGCTGGNLTACIAACPSNPPKAYQDCVNACVKACTKPKVPSVYTVPFNVSSSTGVAFEGFEFHGNATTVGGTQLKLKGNNRGYAVKDYKATKWPDVKYTKLQLLGKTLSWSTDVSNVGCGCNAALYLVAMPDGGNASGARYCDIQMKPPNGCVELDLQEGNAKAMQATLHTVYEDPPSADGVCNQWGCPVNWGKNDDVKFGKGSQGGVDSNKPFQMSAKFEMDGSYNITVTQGGKSFRYFDRATAGNGKPGIAQQDVARTKAALEKGVVLVYSLWAADGDQGMAWLDGGCDAGKYKHCDLNQTSVSFSDVKIH